MKRNKKRESQKEEKWAALNGFQDWEEETRGNKGEGMGRKRERNGEANGGGNWVSGMDSVEIKGRRSQQREMVLVEAILDRNKSKEQNGSNQRTKLM